MKKIISLVELVIIVELVIKSCKVRFQILLDMVIEWL